MSKIALPLHELRSMSEADLIRRHDEEAQSTVTGVDYCLDELHRREQERHTLAMLALTKQMRWMTVVITIATIVGVFATVLGLLSLKV